MIHEGVTYRLEEAEEGGYVASVPGLPGCLSQGDDFDETLANIQEAFTLFVEASVDLGLPLPKRYRPSPVKAV